MAVPNAKGALTINGSNFYPQCELLYYSACFQVCSCRFCAYGSNVITNAPNVAFRTPSGKKVLIVVNNGSSGTGFNIGYKGKYAFASLAAGAVGTYVW